MRTASTIEMFGGSHAGAYGNSTSAYSTGRLVAQHLGATLLATASNGLVLAGQANGFARYLRAAAARRERPDTIHGWPAPADLVVINCGLGDLASSVQSAGMWRPQAFRNALDAIAAFAALAAYYQAEPAGASDPTIAYGGAWVDYIGTDRNTGAGCRSTFGADATLTITVPATFTGEEIDLFWVLLPASFNATITWDITVTGATTTKLTETITSADVDQVTIDQINIKATRITGLRPGAHTITCAARNFAGFGCGFDGWGIAAPNPPNVLLCSQLKAAQSALDGFLGPFPGDTPTPPVIDRFNKDVVAQVANLSIPAIYHAQPDVIIEQPNMTVDGIHPNDTGARLLAAAILDTLEELPQPPPAPGPRPLTPPLATNWTNTGGNYAPATYTLHRDLQVRLAGRLQRAGTPTAPELLLTLPECHRPAKTTTFACPGSTGTPIVDITPDGQVTYRSGTLGASGTIDLDPIQFTARDDGT